MDAALGSQRAITPLSEAFGLLALFLSAIGLYGMLASSVAQRTGEIGVRVALGAQRVTVIWMILADALRLVGAGIVAGAVTLVIAVGYVKHMLYGVSAFDPTTLIVVSAALALVNAIRPGRSHYRPQRLGPASVWPKIRSTIRPTPFPQDFQKFLGTGNATVTYRRALAPAARRKRSGSSITSRSATCPPTVPAGGDRRTSSGSRAARQSPF